MAKPARWFRFFIVGTDGLLEVAVISSKEGAVFAQGDKPLSMG